MRFILAALATVLALSTGFENARAGLIFTVANGGADLETLDSSNGGSSENVSFNYSNSFGLAFHPDGPLYITSNRGLGPQIYTELLTVDPSNGEVTFVTQLGPTGSHFAAIDFDPQGNLYGMNSSGDLYQFNASNGTSILNFDTAIQNVYDLAFNSSGELYGAAGGVLHKFDLLTGQVDSILIDLIDGSSSSVDTSRISGLMFDENDELFATTYTPDSPLLKIDASTGNAWVAANTDLYNPSGGDFAPPVSAVPEPTSLVLFGTFGAGLALYGAFRRPKGREDNLA